MLSTIAFNNFKAQNIAFAVRFVDDDDAAKYGHGTKNKSAQRLARIHQKLRSMYFALSEAEREAYRKMGSPEVNTCVHNTIAILKIPKHNTC